MKRGTTSSTAKGFMRKSNKVRKGGNTNKNVQSRARRKGVSIPRTSPLKGPDRGMG